MRGYDLLYKMELVDPEFIEEAESERRPKRRWTTCAALAACLMLIASALCIPAFLGNVPNDTVHEPDNDGIGGYIIKHVQRDNTGNYEQPGFLPRWDDMVDPERYTEVRYSDINYRTRLIAVHGENTGDMLGKAVAVGQDFHTDEIHSLGCDVYTIRNIDPSAALGVRFGDTDKYVYAYVNCTFVPETLGEFISALDLTNTLSTGVVYYKVSLSKAVPYNEIVYEDIMTETVWDMLLCDTDIKNEPQKEVGLPVIRITASVDLLGYHNVMLNLTEDGYMWTNILDTGKYFNIGKQKVNAFVEEVTRKHQGYIYVYDDLVGAGNEE